MYQGLDLADMWRKNIALSFSLVFLSPIFWQVSVSQPLRKKKKFPLHTRLSFLRKMVCLPLLSKMVTEEQKGTGCGFWDPRTGMEGRLGGLHWLKYLLNVGAVTSQWPSPATSPGTQIKSRWQSRRTCAYLLLRECWNHNSLLNNHWQEDAGTHQALSARSGSHPPSSVLQYPRELQWPGPFTCQTTP